ncbi:MAG: L-arabinose isomerase [Anaerolineae bacterium]
MISLDRYEVWFVTGSQNLYGEETLAQVAEDARAIAGALAESDKLAIDVVFKPVVTTPEQIANVCTAANTDDACIGLITWMHTFSPAKMWIAGLSALQKPFLHLHTQFNRDIPWAEIDMDFMNLNQSAHGGREFGFIASRMRKNRKVVVGHWQDDTVLAEIDTWMRAAAAWQDLQGAKVARFGDNMREVAVTEGDKVAAQIQLGYSTNGYGLGDLMAYVDAVTDGEIDDVIEAYKQAYDVDPALLSGGAKHASLRDAARIEKGMRTFLEEGDFKAFTTTFENLTGLNQLPGLASQRLMAEGYGFGAEGDWKTAALVRAMKVMGAGLEGGATFMEDYTYHLEPGNTKVLGAHMLEVCPSISVGKPRMEIHPLGIGGKDDPVRLVFDVAEGSAVNATIIDLGNRFRMLVNPVEVVPPDAPLPKLPVARAVWVPEPELKVAAAAWILSGGAHHTGFSQAVTAAHLVDFAEIADLECVMIDADTDLRALKNELRWNEVYYALNRGF